MAFTTLSQVGFSQTQTFPAVTVEAEDFHPAKPDSGSGWKAIKNGGGNYMVDLVGFNHISGERVLHADADVKNAVASKSVMIPAGGTYRVWSRFEQPTNVENRFRVEVRQNGKTLGAATMGEMDAPKHFFNAKEPVGQADPSWGSEGLVEQGFDVKGLQAGPAKILISAIDQSTLAFAADRNVDFLFLTQDLQDTWRTSQNNERAARMTFLIDKAGIVRFVDTNVNVQTHGADVLAKIGGLN